MAVEDYCRKLRELHQRNIVISIAHFLNLPRPLYIAPDDLLGALAVCRNTVVGVSLSSIIDVLMPLESDRFSTLDNEYRRVLATGFQHVRGSEHYLVHQQASGTDEHSAGPCFLKVVITAVSRAPSGATSTHSAPLTHSLVEGIHAAAAIARSAGATVCALTLQLHIATLKSDSSEDSVGEELSEFSLDTDETSSHDPDSPSYMDPVLLDPVFPVGGEQLSPIVSGKSVSVIVLWCISCLALTPLSALLCLLCLLCFLLLSPGRILLSLQ